MLHAEAWKGAAAQLCRVSSVPEYMLCLQPSVQRDDSEGRQRRTSVRHLQEARRPLLHQRASSTNNEWLYAAFRGLGWNRQRLGEAVKCCSFQWT